MSRGNFTPSCGTANGLLAGADHGPVDLPRNVSLEAAENLLLGFAFGLALREVGLGGLVMAQPDDDDVVERCVDTVSAASPDQSRRLQVAQLFTNGVWRHDDEARAPDQFRNSAKSQLAALSACVRLLEESLSIRRISLRTPWLSMSRAQWH